ncbi:AzlC family ABC transporter permease [Aestuariivirga litoralis]|nr:AzlC family ABC transporter permease [Aestuariivirga litoralis]MBG1231210.1 AzlC family ABC transporter permease [Aestuariivirga litoralis]
MVLAYVPLAMLWGTLAAAKGFTPIDALLMSFFVYAGASQFIAVNMWSEPLPVLLLIVTALIVNLRHFLMAASISRHIQSVPRWMHPFMIYILTDEAWAIAERRALDGPLSLGYYLGVALPLWPTWFLFSAVGAVIGQSLGDVAALGDFGLAAMFITIIAGFWKGPRTAAVIGASALVAALAKTYVPGQWFILMGGFAGVAVAALLHTDDEVGVRDTIEKGTP